MSNNIYTITANEPSKDLFIHGEFSRGVLTPESMGFMVGSGIFRVLEKEKDVSWIGFWDYCVGG